MLNGDVDEATRERGDYCRSFVPGCDRRVGWPVERMCPVCGPSREAGDDADYCVGIDGQPSKRAHT